MAELRPVRAEAGDPVEVSFTVNGAPATLRLPARVTLSDALRDHLGLTGTHVGCEHGVCGMCTVLVDGQAARACLLFAVQLDGAEVSTVEGLGKPDDLHPLQRSFGRNHALQCGFCTPGFLMSCYDLLTTNPGVRPDELPTELSGVICRCTGYRNIVTAVREVQAEFPDGIPGPGNRGVRTLTGRAAGRAGDEHRDPGTAKPVAPEIVAPAGVPTLTVEVATEVGAPAEHVWTVFDDVRLLARCLPGAELTDELGGDTYAGRARVSVGPVKLAFDGTARILEHDRSAGRLRVIAQGQDAGGAQTQAEIELRTEPSATGTVLRANAKLYLTGRIAQFGRALAGDICRGLFERFADAVAEAATSGRAPGGPVEPTSALKLMVGTLLDRIKHVLRRDRRRR